ncbi:hypothetical protein GETHLI_19950 [Geothrix limicola]|uniref:Uncharacterized protein n=1 Tax=Geothrix limicola TaxID=2927978 RepID=A0ABQ5QFN0_9BACT|nr:hypothetical protein [Geothrix limicola]GLH73493.1 hypothetical protein GETHLI_19950 [Geothrix limicola]
MRSPSARATLLSSLALGAAVLWGTREWIALLKAHLGDRVRLGKRARAV